MSQQKSHFTKIDKTITERVLIFCSPGCRVNSFTDVSFIMVVLYRENAFQPAQELFSAVASGQNWKQAGLRPCIQVYNAFMGLTDMQT